jgi:hypothetical protein
MIDKFFSLEEAESMIPKLEKIVQNMVVTKKNAMEIGDELAALQEQMKAGNRVNASALVNKRTELEFLVKIINEGLEAIEDMGARPKDIDSGLVDFPTMIDGEEALLCWKYGEKSIDFYHSLTAGFAGRKPLKKGSITLR